ncbi:MAG: HepT-like ribonuclease domain-containing protein [Prolixibacteraceae bacterium]
MKGDVAYIENLLLSISKIEIFTANLTRADFEKNEMFQDAVIRNIEIIGEVSKRISNDLKATYFDIPWRDMSGMRDKLIRDYMGVDTEVV